MKVAVIGRGNVGQALAPNIAALGHEVVYGVRDPADPRHDDGGSVAAATIAQAVAGADMVILAVMWSAIPDVLAQAGTLDGAIVVDCTNPFDFADDLARILPPDTSAAQEIARMTSGRVVKAFNQVGAPVMASARGRKPAPLQFVAGDDPDARRAVLDLAGELGFDARDAGGLDFARDLEAIARVWIAQAFGHGMPATTAWVLSEQ